MQAAKYFWSTRPGNCVISAIGVFAGHAIAQNSVAFSTELGIGMAAAFLITGAGNAINDFFDADIDEKLGKAKVEGQAEKKGLLGFSAALFLIGIAAAFAINLQAFAIAVGVSALLILYSGVMQNFKFLGNWVVALGTALTLVFGAAIAQRYEGIFLLAASAFFANVAREIIKDCEDIEGDRGAKNTLPMFVGFEGLKKAIFLFYLAAVSIGVVAFALGYLRGMAFAILFGICAILLINSFRLFNSKDFKAAQKFSKYGMIMALASFVAGAL